MTAWIMEFDEGWFAYCDDEPRLGPFKTQGEAVRAGHEKGWPMCEPDTGQS